MISPITSRGSAAGAMLSASCQSVCPDSTVTYWNPTEDPSSDAVAPPPLRAKTSAAMTSGVAARNVRTARPRLVRRNFGAEVGTDCAVRAGVNP